MIPNIINSDVDYLNTELYSNDFTTSSYSRHHQSPSTTTTTNNIFHTIEENDEDESSAIFEPEEQRYISSLKTRKSYVPDDEWNGDSLSEDDTDDPYAGEGDDERSQQRQQIQQQDRDNVVDYNHESNAESNYNNNEQSSRKFINDNDYGGGETRDFDYQSPPSGDARQQIQSNMFGEPLKQDSYEDDNFEQQQQHKSVSPESDNGSKRDETGHKKQYQPWPYYPQDQSTVPDPFHVPFPLLPHHMPVGGEESPSTLQRARTNEALQQLKSDAFNHMEQMLNVNITKTTELIKKKKKKLTKAEKAKLEIKSRQETFRKLYHPDAKKNKETKKGKSVEKNKDDLSLESDIKKVEKHIKNTYHLAKVQKDASSNHPSILNQFPQKQQQQQQFHPQSKPPPKATTTMLSADKSTESNTDNSEGTLEEQQTQDSLLQDSMKSLEDGWNLDIDTSNDQDSDVGKTQQIGVQQPHNSNGQSPNQAVRFTPSGVNPALFNMNPYYFQQQQQIAPPMLKHQIQPIHKENNATAFKQTSKTFKTNEKTTSTKNNNTYNNNIKNQRKLNISKKKKTNNKKAVKTKTQKKEKSFKAKFNQSKKSQKTEKTNTKNNNNNSNNNNVKSSNNNNNNKTQQQQQTKKKPENLHVQKSTLEENVNQEKEKTIKKLIEKLDAAENIHQAEAAGNTRQDTPQILATDTFGAPALGGSDFPNIYPSNQSMLFQKLMKFFNILNRNGRINIEQTLLTNKFHFLYSAQRRYAYLI